MVRGYDDRSSEQCMEFDVTEAGTLARYGVVGNPVEHSRSPEIHQAFAAQFGVRIQYDKFCVEEDAFAAFVRDFAAHDGSGLNVTVPFKGLAYELVAECDELAEAAAAVNTIRVASNGALQGYNTDGLGLVNDLISNGVVLEGATVLLAGAGGAARGVVLPLLRAGVAALTITNRTRSRADALIASHAHLAPATRLTAADFAAVSQPVDIVINATSLGLQGQTVPLAEAVVHGSFCYDMSYGPAAVFARWAASHGAATSVDGLGMLVEQAAQSFYIWRGERPQTAPVIAALRAKLED